MTGLRPPGDAPRRDVDNSLRWVAELRKQASDKSLGFVQPLPKPGLALDRYVRSELAIHLKARLRAGTSDTDSAEFCAWLHWFGTDDAQSRVGDNAVVRTLDRQDRLHDGHDRRLERPVFVEVGARVENRKNMVREFSLPSLVGLMAPHDCEVCAADSWESSRSPATEFRGAGEDGEVNTALFFFAEAPCSVPTFDKRPSQVVKRGSVVGDHVSKPERPLCREGLDGLRQSQDDAVTLRFIFLVKTDRQERLCVGARRGGREATFESFTLATCPMPLPPRTIELAHWDYSLRLDSTPKRGSA